MEASGIAVRSRLSPARLPGPFMGSSIISGSNENGCPAKFCSRLTAWNASFSGYDPHFEGDEPPGL